MPEINGTVAVISDLHLYSGISNFESNREPYQSRRQEIFEEFSRADHVVLNGDIFDIECAKNPAGKIPEAVAWLRKRMDEAPDTQFHFVLGNHEAFLPFIEAMWQLEQEPQYEGRFFFHEHYLQLGDSVFTHGDEQLGVAHYVKKGKEEKAEITSNEGRRRRSLSELSPLRRAFYEAFNGSYHEADNRKRGMMEGTIATLHESLRPRTLKKAAKLAEEFEKSDLEGLAAAVKSSRHIFTGHTHEAYTAHYKNKYFHNTGAAVRSPYADFRPLRLVVENGMTQRVEPLLEQDRKRFPQRGAEDMPQGETRKYFVTSDLHNFADGVSQFFDWNYGELYGRNKKQDIKLIAAMGKAIKEADVIVLNGDIYELFYTDDTVKTQKQSLKHLRELVKRFPDKEFHFVLGNHEGVHDFIAAMKKLSADMQAEGYKLHFHEHFYQPNEKTVFLHGDEVVGGKFQPRKLYDNRHAQENFLKRTINRGGERLAMQAYVGIKRNPRATARNVSKAIHEVPEIQNPELLENIFIGHTHVPFIDEKQNGKWVTNTGSATNYGRYASVSFEMDETGAITTPHIIPTKIGLGVVRTAGF